MIASHLPRVKASSDPTQLDRLRFQTNAIDHLTSRQKQVLPLLVQGLTAKQIAAKIGRSEARVNKVKSNLIQRLGVANRAELLEMFRSHSV
jgi:DNA-binding NarL/FixJ family response regulator